VGAAHPVDAGGEDQAEVTVEEAGHRGRSIDREELMLRKAHGMVAPLAACSTGDERDLVLEQCHPNPSVSFDVHAGCTGFRWTCRSVPLTGMHRSRCNRAMMGRSDAHGWDDHRSLGVCLPVGVGLRRAIARMPTMRRASNR